MRAYQLVSNWDDAVMETFVLPDDAPEPSDILYTRLAARDYSLLRIGFLTVHSGDLEARVCETIRISRGLDAEGEWPEK
jgi:hypothetical protein